MMPKLVGGLFGDLITNNILDDSSPRKMGVFVKETNGIITATDTKGLFWLIQNNNNSSLTINGQIDFKKYIADYKNIKAVEAEQ